MMGDIVDKLLFDLPNSPEEFSVIVPPPDLRRIDFSGLDYNTARRAIIEYIKTYYPDDFNDFVASNGIIMIMEILAAVTAKLSLRGDLLANEAFLPTARSEAAIVNHLALINQRIKRQTPATVDIELSLDRPLISDVVVDPGVSLTVSGGPDGKPINFEIFKSPGDWNSKIIIPAGKRGVIAWGIEGNFASPVNTISSGGPNQEFTVLNNNILESPIFVSVSVGDSIESWRVVTEPIERFGPNDKVVEVNFINNTAKFRFGDDVTGRAPISGSRISFRFRTGGGIRGRIGANRIDTTRTFTPLPPANAATAVRFRNLTASIGGTDRESLLQAKKRAPKDFAIQRSIVTSNDYVQSAISYKHPVYGSVSKAMATVRTGINANLVEIYVLAEGFDDIPVTPSTGLKLGLKTHFDDLNVLTDYVEILDGAIKPVDIDMNIIINNNTDASIIKERVESVISDYFNISRWSMGQEFYISNFIDAIESIDGISHVDLFQPHNNILRTGGLSDSEEDGIGLNEVIIEGKRKTNYYYKSTSI